MIRPAQVASKTVATTLLLAGFSPLRLVFRHKILDRNGALHRCHDGGKLRETPSPMVLTMRAPWLAATGSMAARCSRKALAVPISLAPISRPQSATSAARIAATPEFGGAHPLSRRFSGDPPETGVTSRRSSAKIAGRAPLRLATFSLPTHREVVAAASRIAAFGAPQSPSHPGSRAFHAACLRSTPPRLQTHLSADKIRYKLNFS